MNVEKDLKEIEKKIISAYAEDGVADFLLGMVLLLFGIMITFARAELVAVCFLPVVFGKNIRKKLTYPRIGYVDPEKMDKNRRKNAMMLTFFMVTFALFIAGIFVFKSNYMDPFFQRNLFLILGIFAVVVLVISALITTVKRLYIYALLVGTIFTVSHFIPIRVGLFIIIFGTIAVVYGLALMIRFTKKYPVITEDYNINEENESRG